MLTFASQALLVAASWVWTGQTSSQHQKPLAFVSSPARFLPSWKVLGPFQIGTREAAWGADPLDLYGGFCALEYDPESLFPSSLSINGTVSWSSLESTPSASSSSTTINLRVAFPDVDWAFLRWVYGWSATQYQTWARGTFEISTDKVQVYELYTDGVMEFFVDGQTHHFGGDIYSYRRSPLVLQLSPGQHKLDVRLVYDVRSMGGIGDPEINVVLELRVVQRPHGSSKVAIVPGTGVFPDIVNGRLVSQFASVNVRNYGESSVEIVDIVPNEMRETELSLALATHDSIVIRPGQTRPLAFRIQSPPPVASNISFSLVCIDSSHLEIKQTVFFEISLFSKSLYEIHKMTYLHPSGIVSYAMIRAPPPSSTLAIGSNPPAFVNLHGAGVEADNPQLSHSLDSIANLSTWTIIPSGVTSWSGDDWHQWGWADVEAAISAVSSWIEAVDWQGPGIDAERLLLVGHSNGGQGVWYGLVHHPDRIIAAAPVSGYASIQKYVPFTLMHETDPRRTAVVEAALNGYRHELLIENAKHIPLLIQHGGTDDNVPVFHARRMNQLANESGMALEYDELEGKGHWFGGVMTTDGLTAFYERVIKSPRRVDVPSTFTLIVANPGDTQSKYGFYVEQLKDPGQLGSLSVNLSGSSLHVSTSNVEAFRMPRQTLLIEDLTIDRKHLGKPPFQSDSLRIVNGQFVLEAEGRLKRIEVRSENQLGNLCSILWTKGPFTIVWHGKESTIVSLWTLQVARNFHQYFAADSFIASDSDMSIIKQGNVISLGIGASIWAGTLPNHPIKLSESAVTIRDDQGHEREYQCSDHGLGAIFLRPFDNGRLELIVWGSDAESLQVAMRLIPLITGTGVPDFVIMTKEMLWKGIHGTLAMGFFASDWNVTRSSFFV